MSNKNTADKSRLKVVRNVVLRGKSVDEVRRIFVEETLPDIPEGHPMIDITLKSIEGWEERISQLDVCDGFDKNGLPLVFTVGDCPCGGSACRDAWGWRIATRDLNMSGHRGSMMAVVCEKFDQVTFDPVTGGINSPPPIGVNVDEWNSGRYEKSEWGNALTTLDKQTLAKLQMSVSEGRTTGGEWVVDE